MAEADGKDTNVRIDAALKEDLWREAGGRGLSIRRYVNDTLRTHMELNTMLIRLGWKGTLERQIENMIAEFDEIEAVHRAEFGPDEDSSTTPADSDEGAPIERPSGRLDADEGPP